MKKLSQSQASKKYLENKTGIKSKTLSTEMQEALEEVSKVANERISKNDVVYKSSNSRSHLYPTNKSSNSDCILAMDFRNLDQEMENLRKTKRSKRKCI